eukprot:XP_002260580.1 [Plasmodium knowlesi strain H]
MPYIRDSGENHIKELTRERVRLNKRTSNSITLGANFLFICNLDNRLSSKDVTHFFNYFIGNNNCVARIRRNKYTGSRVPHPFCQFPSPLHRASTSSAGRNMGHGILKFQKAEDATLVLLNYQGIKLGEKNIILTEAFKDEHLKQKKHICNVLQPSRS